MNKNKLQGLYVITDPILCGSRIIENIEQAIDGGANIIQYRNKTANKQQQLNEAQAVQVLCQRQQRLFIINDDIALALAVNADGVHLGQTDGNIRSAREQLGKQKIIGVTCHSDLDAAKAAQLQGADYVAFGRFYPSHTKPAAPPAEIDILHQAKAQLRLPVVAIGGVTIENASTLINAGADMLAVIHAVFAQDNIKKSAQNFSQLFKQD